jgi:chitodextrinase
MGRVFALVSMLMLCVFSVSFGQVTPPPTTIEDFFLPGSQPGQSGNLEHPDKCDNCHGGYNQDVEPAYNWRGSMMAQAARDPLFYACMAIANQDAPGSGDLCIRCHSPSGWLEGRSIPTDGSALNNNDREGVQCDFCHKAVKPTPLGVNPFPGDVDYAAGTYDKDQGYLATLTNIPGHSANGMYVADLDNAKRGPFVDAAAKHQMLYSPFHQEANICGTCHDVSNPAFNWDETLQEGVPNSFGQAAPDFNPYSLFPVERTFSEWMNSDYNTPQGVFAPQFGGNKQYVSTCQDCHMRDVTGLGCNKRGAPVRDDLPLHDLTGGNTFIPLIVDAAFPGETDPAALQAGIERARAMLQMAASLDVTATDPNGNAIRVTVTNETGHKLPSGYPEGRRIWLNVKAVDPTGATIYESGAYDLATAVLSHDADAKIYEIEPGISANLSPVVNIPEGKSFHFVLNNKIFKDNRIPPRGFTNAAFQAIQSPPVAYSYADGQYWDETDYVIPGDVAEITVTLYYQTTTREYVEFLRDENYTNDWGQRFYDLWAANGKSTPEVMAQQTLTFQPVSGDTEPPTVPGNLVATTIGSGQIDLTWDPSTDNIGVVEYWVYRDGARVATSANTSYSDLGLTPSTTYDYNVTAVDAAANESGMSNTATATTDAAGGGDTEPPTPPSNLVASAPKWNRIDLVWEASTDNVGVAEYWVFRDGDQIATTVETTYSDGMVQQLTTYTYYVQATDAAGNVSAASNTASATTPRKKGGKPVNGVATLNTSLNPFNASTRIAYSLPEASSVLLEVYDIMGRRVATLDQGRRSAGEHEITWNAGHLPSGVYLVRFVSEAENIVTKVTLLK